VRAVREKERFDTAASSLLQQIPAALRAAHGRALAAHVGGGPDSHDAYGGTLWLIQHEELVGRAGVLDGARVIKPRHSRYPLVVINGVVMYPVRYASDGTPVEDARLREPVPELRRALFGTLAPALAAVQRQGTLAFDGEEDHLKDAEVAREALTQFAPYARLVVIAYASNPRGGILNAE